MDGPIFRVFPMRVTFASLATAALVAVSPMALMAQEAADEPDVDVIQADDAIPAPDPAVDEPAADAGAEGDAPDGENGVVPPEPPAPPPAPPAPPPPPVDPPLEVYIAVDGETTGPFDRATLEAKVAAGELSGTSLVWQQGMEEWLAADDVPEVAALLAETAPEPAPELSLSDDPMAFIAGTWALANDNLQIQGGGTGSIEGNWTFSEDGRFTMNAQLSVAEPVPMMITMAAAGPYTVQLMTETSFSLTPQGQVTFTVPGVAQETEPFNETGVFVVIDANTMRDGEGTILTRVQ